MSSRVANHLSRIGSLILGMRSKSQVKFQLWRTAILMSQAMRPRNNPFQNSSTSSGSPQLGSSKSPDVIINKSKYCPFRRGISNTSKKTEVKYRSRKAGSSIITDVTIARCWQWCLKPNAFQHKSNSGRLRSTEAIKHQCAERHACSNPAVIVVEIKREDEISSAHPTQLGKGAGSIDCCEEFIDEMNALEGQDVQMRGNIGRLFDRS
ncbi:hypothetical protein TNCV_3434781 [Trichonephila clavipes]|nr:hypothetical protein TNCV_3434781 [Trichonephila clavipes]